MTERERRITELFNRYYDDIVRYAKSVSHDLSKEDAQDIAQETFIRTHKALDGNRGEADWKYLKTTAHNLAKNRFRRSKTKKHDEANAEDATRFLTSASPTPEHVFLEQEESAEREAKLKRVMAIAGLPEVTRLVFLLRVRGKKYREIVDTLEIPMNAVKWRLADAIERLRHATGDPQLADEDDDDHE